MKKFLLLILAMTLCVSLLTNCKSPTENQEPNPTEGQEQSPTEDQEQCPTEDQEHEHIWRGVIASTKYYFTQGCSICGAQKRIIRESKAYWEATYANGKVTLGEPTAGDTAIELVAVEEINIQNEGYHNSFADITLRIRANESKTYLARVKSYRSDDDLGDDSKAKIALVQGEETTVNFQIYGFYNSFYFASIEIDNTVIVLHINP